MTDRKTKSHQVTALDHDIAANIELFREADRLDEAAYQIIQYDGANAEALAQFTEAKALADAKRAVAQKDWERIKRMTKI
jgi:hypothetical protein